MDALKYINRVNIFTIYISKSESLSDRRNRTNVNIVLGKRSDVLKIICQHFSVIKSILVKVMMIMTDNLPGYYRSGTAPAPLTAENDWCQLIGSPSAGWI